MGGVRVAGGFERDPGGGLGGGEFVGGGLDRSFFLGKLEQVCADGGEQAVAGFELIGLRFAEHGDGIGILPLRQGFAEGDEGILRF